jgi:LuxR family maltose regulon positive regulatory protein
VERSPLTSRERELLGMLASGLSNQEIADRLVMTVGTVKWYLHHLYGKLAVRGRLAAMARARELGVVT